MVIVNNCEIGRPYSVISLVDGVGEATTPFEAKNIAVSSMIQAAEKLGADAVINVRMTSNAIAYIQWGVVENYSLIAYGTAVKFI